MNIQLTPIHTVSADTLFTTIDRNRAYLEEWLPWVSNTKAVKDSAESLNRFKHLNEEQKAASFAIFINGTLQGVVGLSLVGLNTLTLKEGRANLGYWIDQTMQGQGIITNACKHLMYWGYQTHGISQYIIRANPNNQKSAAIAKKIGFTFQKAHINEQALLLNHRLLHIYHYDMRESDLLPDQSITFVKSAECIELGIQ